jgi:hypothetical protein
VNQSIKSRSQGNFASRFDSGFCVRFSPSGVYSARRRYSWLNSRESDWGSRAMCVYTRRRYSLFDSQESDWGTRTVYSLRSVGAFIE